MEKFNRSIVKMIHGAIAEKKDPKTEVHKFLTNYRNTPHDTTGKCPSQLLMNRTIRTKVPVLIPCPTGKAHKEARQADRKQHKNYADKDREEKDMPDDSDKEKKDTPEDGDKEEKDGD